VAITIDTRAGSKNLIAPLKGCGLDVIEGILPAGDIEIIGRGPLGPVPVGIEYKSWSDVLACMRNGRFAEQAREMWRSYSVSWLLIQGEIRIGPRGLLHLHGKRGWEVAPGHYTHQEVTAWLQTVSAKAGILLWRTASLHETVEWVRSVYHWWTAKEWADHRSHLDFYQPPESPVEMLEEPSYVQKVASVLPGIGTVKAPLVAGYFPSIKELANAGVADWKKVKGIGPKIAITLVETIDGKGGKR